MYIQYDLCFSWLIVMDSPRNATNVYCISLQYTTLNRINVTVTSNNQTTHVTSSLIADEINTGTDQNLQAQFVKFNTENTARGKVTDILESFKQLMYQPSTTASRGKIRHTRLLYKTNVLSIQVLPGGPLPRHANMPLLWSML